MGVEIERKFLVRDTSVLVGSSGIVYRQGYLSTDPERTVRVRTGGDRAFLTIKGLTDGATRAEFEYEIPATDGDDLIALCAGPVIVKTRHRIEDGGFAWEVDVFGGDNAGLVVAEVEVPSAKTAVPIPDWIGAEVTGDPRYFNSNLVNRPFREWDGDVVADGGSGTPRPLP